MTLVDKKAAEHIVGRISGVTSTDTRVEAAQKAIALMRSAGFSARSIRKAESILAELKRRDGEGVR